MDMYLIFIERYSMGKLKVTSETLVDKCTVYNCKYNEKGFCHLATVMLDDNGCCIYRKEESNGKTQSTMG